MRKLLDEDPEKNTQLLKGSCKPTITLMKDIFSSLKLKDNNLEPCDTIEDDIISDFFSGLKLDEKLTCNETAESLPDTPLLSAYLKHACKEQKYFFLLKNLGLITVFLVLLLDYPLTCFLLDTISQTLNQAKSVKAITKYLTKFMLLKQKSFCHQTPLPKDQMVYLLIRWNKTQIALKFSLSVTTVTSHA